MWECISTTIMGQSFNKAASVCGVEQEVCPHSHDLSACLSVAWGRAQTHGEKTSGETIHPLHHRKCLNNTSMRHREKDRKWLGSCYGWDDFFFTYTNGFVQRGGCLCDRNRASPCLFSAVIIENNPFIANKNDDAPVTLLHLCWISLIINIYLCHLFWPTVPWNSG